MTERCVERLRSVEEKIQLALTTPLQEVDLDGLYVELEGFLKEDPRKRMLIIILRALMLP